MDAAADAAAAVSVNELLSEWEDAGFHGIPQNPTGPSPRDEWTMETVAPGSQDRHISLTGLVENREEKPTSQTVDVWS